MRVALYARVSAPQSGQNQSIEDQLERLRAFSNGGNGLHVGQYALRKL